MHVTIGRLLIAALVVPSVTIGSSGCAHSGAAVWGSPRVVEPVPPHWVDLPDAPFVVKMKGTRGALVNRSTLSFNEVTTGCVVNDGGKVRVVGTQFGTSVDHGVFAPKFAVPGLLETIAGTDWEVTNLRTFGRPEVVKPCPAGTRIAVIEASLRGVHSWSAAGTRWPD